MMYNGYEKVSIGNPYIKIEVFKERKADVSDKLLRHEQIEIKYVLRGTIEIYCNTHTHILHKDDIFIVNPCEGHCNIRTSDDAKYNMIVIDPAVLDTAGSVKYMESFLSGKISITNLIRKDDRISQIITEMIIELSDKKQGYEMYGEGLVLKLFALLFRNYSRESTRISDTAYMKRLEPVLSYMMTNYSNKIDLNKMGTLCGVSGKRLCKIFKSAFGVSPIKYLAVIRMNKAEMLLTTTSLTVAEIAEMTGYQDSLYFSRRFRQIKGCSPTEKRNRDMTIVS